MGVCRGEKQNLDAVREPHRAVILMKEIATEGVVFRWEFAVVSGDIIQCVCGLFRDIKKIIFKRKKEKSVVFDNYYLHLSL